MSTGPVRLRDQIGGDFDLAFRKLSRFARRAADPTVQVVWKYVVFRWNDRDDQFRRAIAMAGDLGVPIWFDFAHTWGWSRRDPRDLDYLIPYLRPYTALPGGRRQEGW